MSLEQAITDNTAAVLQLTEVLKSASTTGQNASASKGATTGKQATTKAEKATTTKSTEATASTPDVTFDQVQAKGREVAKLDKENGTTNVRDLLKKYKAAKLSDVDVSDFAALLADFTAALEQPESEAEPSGDDDLI